MKSTPVLGLIALCSVVLTLFNSCKQEPPKPPPPPTLAEILKDLDPSTYYLSFDNPADQKIVGSASLGSLSGIEEMTVSSDLVGFRIPTYARVPIFRLIWPTCPSMIRDLDWAKRFTDFATLNKLSFAAELQPVKLENNVLLVTQSSLKTLAGYMPDQMDSMGMSGVALDKVFICPDPPMSKFRIKRPAYGLAIQKIVLPPKLAGCFDPENLHLVLKNLQKIDKKVFANYKVEVLENKTGTLTSGQ